MTEEQMATARLQQRIADEVARYCNRECYEPAPEARSFGDRCITWFCAVGLALMAVELIAERFGMGVLS